MYFNKRVCLIIILFNSMFHWSLFHPLISDVDVEYLYNSVLSGNFSDWFPPLMPIITHLLMKVNISFGVINFFQCVLLQLGVYILSNKIVHLLDLHFKSKAQLTSFIIIISPLSPLINRSLTWSIDTWFTISFVFLVFLIIDIFQHKKSLQFYIKRILFISFLGAIGMHLRHNALILFPLLTLYIYFIPSLKVKFFFKFFSSLAAIMIFLIIYFSIHSAYHIKKKHHFNSIMFLDIIGVIVDNPEIIDEFPYIKSVLEPHYKDSYIHGNVGPLMWTQPLIIKNFESEIYGKKNIELINEYKKMIFLYPFELFSIKLKAFKNFFLLSSYETSFFLRYNHLGISQNQNFNTFRTIYSKVDQHIFNKALTIKSTIRGVAIWFFLYLFVIHRLIFLNFSKTNIIILLFPIFYASSYLVACPGPGYRLIYPSILIIQIFTLPLIINQIYESLNNYNDFKSQFAIFS